MPTKDPYSGLHSDSVYALWHDPLTYDHMKHGPPYLPEMSVKMASLPLEVQAGIKKEADDLNQIWQQILASVGNAPMCELSILLSFLRAEAWIHQAHHWQTRGCSYYGDHLLFERLYNDANGMVDGLAEKAVGTGDHMLVQPLMQGESMLAVLRCLYGDAPENPGAEEYGWISLRAVLRFLAVERMVYESLESKGQLSHGIDNMLQGIADKHEEFVYLLKQRTKGKTASVDHKSAAWKAASGLSLILGPEVGDLLKRHPKVSKVDGSATTGTTNGYSIEFVCEETGYSLRFLDLKDNAVLRLERRGNAGVMLKTGVPQSWSAKRVYDLVADKLDYWHP